MSWITLGLQVVGGVCAGLALYGMAIALMFWLERRRSR